MAPKLIVKHININNLDKKFCREFDLESVDVKIQELLDRIANDLNLQEAGFIDFLYRGKILNKSETLVKYINPSEVEIDVYLVQTNKSTIRKVDNHQEKPTSHEIYTLVNSLGSIFRSRTKKNFLEVLLQDQQRLDEILNSFPLIKNDLVSYGFIQNYDLIKYLLDQKRAESMINSNPNIFYAVKLIADHVREFSKKTPLDENFISKRSYSIDDASEDEEQTQASNNLVPSVRAGPAISQDHFAAVLAMLNQQQRTGGAQSAQQPPQSRPNVSNQPASQQSGGLFFERSQFQNIMQQIMSQQQQPQAQPNRAAQSIATPTPTQQVSSDLAAKLEQMHEFGFFDDALNMRALEVTEGNVEAAISLIIEGGDII